MSVTHGDLVPVVDYARASADKAKDEHTVSDQQTVNEQTAARLGCRIVARFRDNDKSAAKEDVTRVEFEDMLKVLRAGRLPDGTPVMGCIVVAEDRLVRRAAGHFSSKSRRYSVTLTQLRQARADHAAQAARQAAGQPEPDSNRTTVTTGQWKYLGSGLMHGEHFWAEQARNCIQQARAIRNQHTERDEERKAS